MAITSATINSHCITDTSFSGWRFGGGKRLMELSRRDFLYSHLLSYLHYQPTTSMIKLASAVIPISNFQQIGIDTYLCQP